MKAETKTKLGNSDMRNLVDSMLSEKLTIFFEENPSVGKAIIDKAQTASRAREAARKAREMTRRKSALESGSLPGQAGRLSGARSEADRDLHCRGRFRRRFCQGRP